MSLPVPSTPTGDSVVTAPRRPLPEQLTRLPEGQLLVAQRTATMVVYRDSALWESGSVEPGEDDE